jgi:hypothetical protein
MTRVKPQVAAWGISFLGYKIGQVIPRAFPEKPRERGALWKLPPLRKSDKVAFGIFFLMISSSGLEKPPHKPLRLSHSYAQRRLRPTGGTGTGNRRPQTQNSD